MSTDPIPISTISHLPFELRQALESGECVLFVGAGIGGSLFDKDGKPLPFASELATEMAAFFGIDTEGSTDLTKVSQVVEIRKRGRKELNAFLQKRFTDIKPNEDVRWLSTRPWKAIFTTNYDNGIERAYELNPRTIQIPVVATVTTDVETINPMIEVPHCCPGKSWELQDKLMNNNVLAAVTTGNDLNSMAAHEGVGRHFAGLR